MVEGEGWGERLRAKQEVSPDFDFLKALSVSNLKALAVTVWLVEDTKHKCAYFLNCFEQKYLPSFFLNTSEKKLSYI